MFKQTDRLVHRSERGERGERGERDERSFDPYYKFEDGDEKEIVRRLLYAYGWMETLKRRPMLEIRKLRKLTARLMVNVGGKTLLDLQKNQIRNLIELCQDNLELMHEQEERFFCNIIAFNNPDGWPPIERDENINRGNDRVLFEDDIIEIRRRLVEGMKYAAPYDCTTETRDYIINNCSKYLIKGLGKKLWSIPFNKMMNDAGDTSRDELTTTVCRSVCYGDYFLNMLKKRGDEEKPEVQI